MPRKLFTRRFWADTAERSIKTAAQTILTGVALSDAGPINAFTIDPGLVVGFGVGGAVFSILSSIASAPVGDTGTASVVR